jgi:hypothetical protein
MKRLTCPSLFALTILGAACTGGDRNQSGECPADEECSPLTPRGMHFTGVALTGVPLLAQPKITAVGGTQRIELFKVDAAGDIVPLDLPFDAMTDNGDALSIVSEGTNSTVIRGDATGKDLLRITEPDSELLYDRYEVESDVLARMEVVPTTFEPHAAGDIGFYVGDVGFGLELYSADGARLADDSLTLTFPGPQPSRPAWDEFELADLGPGNYPGTVLAAGQEGVVSIRVYDAVDEVLPLSDSFLPTIQVGAQGEVCFHASVDAGAESVIGLPWNITFVGAVTQLIALSSNCINLQVNAPGQFSVTAETLGVSTTIQFDAVAATAATPAPSDVEAAATTDRLLEAYRASRGERARLLDR